MSDLGIAIADAGPVLAMVLGAGLALLSLVLSVSGSPWAPLLVVASVPVQRVIEFGPDSFNLTATQLVLGGFFAGAGLRFLQNLLPVRIDAIFILSGALALLYAATVLVAPAIGSWAGETYRWAVAVLFLWIARSYFRRLDPRHLLYACAGLAIVSLVWALVQIAADDGPASFTRNGVLRAYGAFGEPNPFAAFIVAVTLPCLSFALFASTWTQVRLAAGAAGSFGLVALALTQSRGAMLGAFAGIGVMGGIWIAGRFRHGPVVAVTAAAIAAAVVILAAASLSPPGSTEGDVTVANWAAREREAHWRAAWAMTEENPLLGVGAGGFEGEFRDATTNWHFRISRGHAHNAYLQVASEAGLLALVLYICLLGAILAGIWRRTGFDACDWLRWGVFALTIAMMTHQLFDYLHVLSLGLLYAGLWAAALSAGTAEEHLEHHCRV